MANYQALINAFFKAKFLDIGFQECVDWAVRQLDQNPNNMNVMILAGLEKNDYWEIKKYIEAIIGSELVDSSQSNENWAGKYLLELEHKFKEDQISIQKLDEILSKIYYRLDYPNWLVMLARNCEYATDVDAFMKPFLDELDYVCSIWRVSATIEEFNQKYDRKISNSHDW